MNDVTDALKDFANLFEALSIPYAAMGGVAVRYFGIPRPTDDVGLTNVLISTCFLPSVNFNVRSFRDGGVS
jgi:hypothetical protein